jgi:hypothetical protein
MSQPIVNDGHDYMAHTRIWHHLLYSKSGQNSVSGHFCSTQIDFFHFTIDQRASYASEETYGMRRDQMGATNFLCTTRGPAQQRDKYHLELRLHVLRPRATQSFLSPRLSMRREGMQ